MLAGDIVDRDGTVTTKWLQCLLDHWCHPRKASMFEVTDLLPVLRLTLTHLRMSSVSEPSTVHHSGPSATSMGPLGCSTCYSLPLLLQQKKKVFVLRRKDLEPSEGSLTPSRH